MEPENGAVSLKLGARGRRAECEQVGQVGFRGLSVKMIQDREGHKAAGSSQRPRYLSG